ncbi:hypothetical protein JCM8547_004448 [Rhodosporidiobolus lusitaniae]
MPELPEVEAARKRLAKLAKGKKIKTVVANEDPIVFSGTTHANFATGLEGKTVKDVRRLGKNFYLILSTPPHPIFHFGMSGMAHIRGEPSPVYRVPRSAKAEEWPPKYLKACITFTEGEGEEEKEVGEWAFCDPRRLGRIKFIEGEEVEKVPPLSELGADPLLNMPSVEALRASLAKRNAPIKAVLLDQNGPLCGIGNYMVDEILFQCAIHPSHPASHLTTLASSSSPPSPTSNAPNSPSPDALETLHANILYVTRTAVEADADADKFPKSWLFAHRWGKGKKGEKKEFELPDGSTSPISFVTVGGRTSAVVDKIQILPAGIGEKAKKRKASTPKKKRGRGRKESADEEEESVDDREDEAKEMDEEEEDEKPEVASPHFKRKRLLKEEDDHEEEKPSTGPCLDGKEAATNLLFLLATDLGNREIDESTRGAASLPPSLHFHPHLDMSSSRYEKNASNQTRPGMRRQYGKLLASGKVLVWSPRRASLLHSALSVIKYYRGGRFGGLSQEEQLWANTLLMEAFKRRQHAEYIIQILHDPAAWPPEEHELEEWKSSVTGGRDEPRSRFEKWVELVLAPDERGFAGRETFPPGAHRLPINIEHDLPEEPFGFNFLSEGQWEAVRAAQHHLPASPESPTPSHHSSRRNSSVHGRRNSSTHGSERRPSLHVQPPEDIVSPLSNPRDSRALFGSPSTPVMGFQAGPGDFTHFGHSHFQQNSPDFSPGANVSPLSGTFSDEETDNYHRRHGTGPYSGR